MVMRPPPRATTVVGIYGDSIEAHLALHLLKVEGIPAVIIDEHLLTYEPLWGPAVGGIKVAVSPADSAAAQGILVRCREAAEGCPNCGSMATSTGSIGRRLAFLTLLFFGFPIGRSRKKHQCADCRHAWRE